MIYIKCLSIFALILTALYVFAVESGYADEVTIAWDKNKEHDLYGYKVYYDTRNISNSGQIIYRNFYNVPDKNATSATIKNLLKGHTYYFAVTAYDNRDNESEYSKEVRYVVPYKPEPKDDTQLIDPITPKPIGLIIEDSVTLLQNQNTDTIIIPSEHDFGYEEMGGASPDIIFTIANKGLDQITIKDINVDSDIFLINENNCSEWTLEPGARCSFNVSFSPLSEGHVDGTIFVYSSNSTVLQVPLKGYGTSWVREFKGTVSSEFSVAAFLQNDSVEALLISKERGVKVYLNIIQIEDKTIQLQVPNRRILIGSHNIELISKRRRTAMIENVFIAMEPQIQTVLMSYDFDGMEIDIYGFFFGSSRARVYLGYNEDGKEKRVYCFRKANGMCKILDWIMDPVTGQSLINLLVSDSLPGRFDIIVKNLIGSDIKSIP